VRAKYRVSASVKFERYGALKKPNTRKKPRKQGTAKLQVAVHKGLFANGPNFTTRTTRTRNHQKAFNSLESEGFIVKLVGNSGNYEK